MVKCRKNTTFYHFCFAIIKTMLYNNNINICTKYNLIFLKGGISMLDPLLLARIQFAATTVFHFFFVPITIGMVFLIAIFESIYVKTGDEHYKRITKFFGHLFLINFAVGVVTGILQEFQFGMNWSEYSSFVGDVFWTITCDRSLTCILS